MERSAFAYRVLMALGFGVISVILLVAVYVGLLGPTLQSWLRTQLAPFVDRYRAHPEAFHLGILIIGTAVSAVTGSLAIMKAFYYAETNLPARLQELIEEARGNHLAERAELLAYVRHPFKTQDFLVPAVLANPVSRLLNLVGISSVRYRARTLAASVHIRAEEIAALTSKREEIEDRKVTGHLLRAEYFSALSKRLVVHSAEWHEQLGAALREYRAALETRGDDLDALQGAVVQMELLNESPAELIRMLRRCVNAARRRYQPLQQARARRKIAELEDVLDTPKSWNAAREQLVVAQNLLRPIAIPGTSEEIEMAATLLLYGEIQIKRERFWSAGEALRQAKRLFQRLNDKVGVDRADDAINRLREASGDNQGPAPSPPNEAT